MNPYESRITGYGSERPEDLLANPQNWRKHPGHQQEAMAGILETVGWVNNVIVNENTGHVVDGHMRVTVAMRNGDEQVPVTYVNLTEEEERIILATYDPLSALATQDSQALADLLTGIRDQTNNSVQALLDRARDSALVSFGGLTMDHGAKIAGGESQGSARIEGAHSDGRDSKQMLDDYLNTSVRQIVLIFNEEDYKDALRAIKLLLEVTGKTTTSAAVLQLLMEFEEDETAARTAEGSPIEASFSELG